MQMVWFVVCESLKHASERFSLGGSINGVQYVYSDCACMCSVNEAQENDDCKKKNK